LLISTAKGEMMRSCPARRFSMITARLAGWERRVGPNGIAFVAPGGPDTGTILVEEHFAPPIPLRSLAAARGVVVDHPRTGGDGDSGDLVVVRQPASEGEGFEILGMVLGDSHFTLVSGATHNPEHLDRTVAGVRHLVRALTFAMTVRRRRFVYGAPEGWTPVNRGLETEWYPPDLERDPARLTVFPAIEHRGVAAVDALVTLVGEQLEVAPRFAAAEWTESITRSGILSFLRSSATVAEQVVELAVAVDSSYIYAFRLEGRAHHRPILEAALAEATPLATAAEPNISAVAHWAE
jgi:hypothetical protein